MNLEITMQATDRMPVRGAVGWTIGAKGQHARLAVPAREARHHVERCEVAPMQIFENENPGAAGAQGFQKIAKLPQHPLARRTEHLILESRAFRWVDGTWQLQYLRANGRNQFRAVRPITVHQRIDEWQEDLARSKPFGAAPTA